MNAETVIIVADAGSAAKGNFHWASSAADDGPSTSPMQLAESIVAHIKAGRRVALGFEAPLFVPVPQREEQLGKARDGECTPETGNRPFNAGAGASLFATGIQSLVWVLKQVKQLRPETTASTLVGSFRSGLVDVLVWEAFVSGKEKANPPSHVGDAQLAVAAFKKAVITESPQSAIRNLDVFSLAGAAILRAGLSQDPSLLGDACLVLRPTPNDPRNV